MIALLDTSILIARTSDKESLPELDEYDGLAVSTLSWAELVKGLHTATHLPVFRQRSARLGELRDAFGAGLAFDEACVASYERIMNHLLARNADPRAHAFDRMIAATALAHEMALVTRDRSGFSGLDEFMQIDIR